MDSGTLWARHQCERLVIDLASLNDRSQFQAAANLFCEDGVMYHPMQPDIPWRGRPQIVESLQRRPVDTLSHHVCTNIAIDMQSDASAFGTTYYTVYLQPGGETKSGPFVFDGTVYVGTYRDSFVRTSDGWRIHERRGCHRFLIQPGK
jgi:hypothetical protein